MIKIAAPDGNFEFLKLHLFIEFPVIFLNNLKIVERLKLLFFI